MFQFDLAGVYDFKNDSDNFDFILSKPPPSPSRSFIHSIRTNIDIQADLDEGEVAEFPNFVSKLLKATNYVIVVMQFYSFHE